MIYKKNCWVNWCSVSYSGGGTGYPVTLDHGNEWHFYADADDTNFLRINYTIFSFE